MAYMIKILRHAPIVSSFKVAMLCMDPHYRTLRGLLLLIQKDAPSLRERWMMFMDTGWWFGTCAIFPYIGNTYPSWLIFFRGVETTNQDMFDVWMFINPSDWRWLAEKRWRKSRAWQEFCSFGHRFRTRLANGEKPTSEWHGSSAIAASRWPSLGFFGSPYAIRELYNTCWWHVIYLRNVWKIVCVCIIECLVNYVPDWCWRFASVYWWWVIWRIT